MLAGAKVLVQSSPAGNTSRALVQAGTGDVTVHYTGVSPYIPMSSINECTDLGQACVREHLGFRAFYKNCLTGTIS